MGTWSFQFTCLLFLWGVSGEVADNFDECSEYFFRGIPVSGLEHIALPVPTQNGNNDLRNECLSAYNAVSPAHICQRYEGEYHFATLYDRGRRIPLYSAYLVDSTLERPIWPRSVTDWLDDDDDVWGRLQNYEPELVHPGPDMSPDQMDIVKSLKNISDYNRKYNCLEENYQYKPVNKLKWSQAHNDDFKILNLIYNRGHLNPAGAHVNYAKEATMTYTNVAPQNIKINGGAWNRYEEKMRLIRQVKNCSKMYAVTGVVPSDEWVWVGQERRVNVPSYYWSAYCCTKNDGSPPNSKGALCKNSEFELGTRTKVKEMRVVQLEHKLKRLFNLNAGNNFRIFKDKCRGL